MKADAAEMPYSAEITPLVGRQQRLRCIFDHQQMMFGSDRHDRIHIAANTGVMHNGDGLGAWRNRRLDQALVEIDVVGTHVDKHRHRAAQRKRVGCRDKGVGRHDDFVARRQVTQHGRHFQGTGAGVCKQRALAAETLFEPLLAAFGVITIAGQMAARERIGDIGQFGADGSGFVKGYFHDFMHYVGR